MIYMTDENGNLVPFAMDNQGNNGLQMDLLWENTSNQTGSYSFTLNKPYSDYKYIEILYKTRDIADVTNATTGKIKTSDISLNSKCILEGSYAFNGYSIITFTSETILNKDTFIYSHAWGTSQTTQLTEVFCNPVYVYGIK